MSRAGAKPAPSMHNFKGLHPMIQKSLAALIALGLSATAAMAQPSAPSERPAAAARAARTGSDEPAAAGPVVERRTDRGAMAGEHRITDADIATAPLMEQAKSSHHTVVINGQTIGYTATAGTLTLRSDDGKPIASMFYVAYTADGGKNRPVTFSYNGGPGSASLFVHMGLAGPVHVNTDSPGATHGPPFNITENHESLLDKSDMVFLDAIGAGYSRPLGDTKGAEFWGVDQDIDAFARGIQRYVTINHRWNSPKFLFGESYGTTRSAGLVYALQQRGLQFNGVLLLSSVLNYGAHDSGFDHSYVSYVPSFAATAVYWKRSAIQPKDLNAYLDEVRAWAAGPYLTALTKGGNISPQEFDATAKQLSAYIGIPAEFIKRANLRVDLNHFRVELLRDQNRILGRYDTRFTGINTDNVGENAEYDPSDTGINGAYVAALHDWVEQLGYTTDLNYWPSGPNINQAWDWRHRPPGGGFGGGGRKEAVANTAADMGVAMRQNPHLMVYALNGYYDMATPFFGTEYDISHLYLDPSIKGNVRFGYYASGHMVYLNQDALKQMKADVARFYDDALAKK
ncbi:S10 family peptidase [Phenylobacterium sp.]|uniref:S10 family peptidase n=1 Tax=Phenylobacterium sp. TaxID=1871053 RepID=UPI00374D1366